MVFKNRFTAEVFLKFLRRLIRQAGRKAFLILDSHPVHRSGRVKRFVAENSKRIRLEFLPGYSPEINPDEYLNQDVKSNAVGPTPATDTGSHGRRRALVPAGDAEATANR